MALDAQKALQLSALLAMTSQQFAVNNPGQQQLAQGLLGSAQAGIQAEALKKAKKEQEKKEKGAFGGKVGSLLGTAAGIALAPVTGGASLALAGAAGGALGGAAGSALAGGSPSGSQALTDGIMGGMNAYQYGKSSQFAQPDNAAAERPLTETLGKSTIPAPATLPANPVGLYPTSPKQGQLSSAQAVGALPYVEPDRFQNMKRALGFKQETPMLPNGAPAIPMQGGMHPSTNNAMNAAQKPMGFGQRFMGGIAQGLGIEQQRRVVRNPDGTVDLY